jgi:hypothetical protein
MPNYKYQTTNKSQYPITKTDLVPIGRESSSIRFSYIDSQNLFGILNFGHCNLFAIWDLLFVISIKSTDPGTNITINSKVYKESGVFNPSTNGNLHIFLFACP